MGHETPPDGGAIAGRYTLGRVIGAGATATVYAGRDLVADRPVAVKVYRLGGEMHPRIQQIRELAALTMLRHPGLVTLYDGGTEPGRDGRTYLVTDLVKGPTLAERLREGPLDIPFVRGLAAGLAAALTHVHAHGFVHRDVKPANILLENGREPRLADFGIAKALDGTVATATGSVAGTAAYLAPEQVRGGRSGTARDPPPRARQPVHAGRGRTAAHVSDRRRFPAVRQCGIGGVVPLRTGVPDVVARDSPGHTAVSGARGAAPRHRSRPGQRRGDAVVRLR